MSRFLSVKLLASLNIDYRVAFSSKWACIDNFSGIEAVYN
jgi:hypothetical protein